MCMHTCMHLWKSKVAILHTEISWIIIIIQGNYISEAINRTTPQTSTLHLQGEIWFSQIDPQCILISGLIISALWLVLGGEELFSSILQNVNSSAEKNSFYLTCVLLSDISSATLSHFTVFWWWWWWFLLLLLVVLVLVFLLMHSWILGVKAVNWWSLVSGGVGILPFTNTTLSTTTTVAEANLLP